MRMPPGDNPGSQAAKVLPSAKCADLQGVLGMRTPLAIGNTALRVGQRKLRRIDKPWPLAGHEQGGAGRGMAQRQSIYLPDFRQRHGQLLFQRGQVITLDHVLVAYHDHQLLAAGGVEDVVGGQRHVVCDLGLRHIEDGQFPQLRQVKNQIPPAAAGDHVVGRLRQLNCYAISSQRGVARRRRPGPGT